MPRLHYTLTTGQVASKTQAGLYAREAFQEQWHRVIDEALRIRQGRKGRSLYWSPLTRRREALAFVEMVIDDALRLGAEGAGT